MALKTYNFDKVKMAQDYMPSEAIHMGFIYLDVFTLLSHFWQILYQTIVFFGPSWYIVSGWHEATFATFFKAQRFLKLFDYSIDFQFHNVTNLPCVSRLSHLWATFEACTKFPTISSGPLLASLVSTCSWSWEECWRWVAGSSQAGLNWCPFHT